jgi:hypothetical protein
MKVILTKHFSKIAFRREENQIFPQVINQLQINIKISIQILNLIKKWMSGLF